MGSSTGHFGRTHFAMLTQSFFRLPRMAAVVMAVFCGGAAAAPVVITAPIAANPGDFITLQGSGFGAAPRVFIKTASASAQTEIPIKEGQDNIIVVRIPATTQLSLYTLKVFDNASSWSVGTLINAPHTHHFDSPDIAPGMPNRIYGRNLLMTGATPSVVLLDTVTNAQLAASVSASNNQQIYLTFTPPSSVIPGRIYKAIVSNGYGSTTTDATALGHAPGNDYFKIGHAWAFDYVTRDGPGYRAGVAGTNQADHHIFNVKTDPSLAKKAVGNGVTDDSAAIQAALDLASKSGGGIVYLPPGTYSLGVKGVAIRPGVVLQGHSNADTKIIYGPTTPQGSSFSMAALSVPDNGALTGIADLTLVNLDRTSQKVGNFGLRGGVTAKLFLQRVNWDLGSGSALSFVGDRIAVLNSTFIQSINYQNGTPLTGGIGPFRFNIVTNLIFANNSVKWATDETVIGDAVNARIENNHFTRSASDTIVASAAESSWPYIEKPIAVGDVVSRRLGRQLAMGFSRNIFVYGNIFDVSDGAIKHNWNDGETILNESRGRDDMGVVTSASATTVSANSKCSGVCTWNFYANSVVFIVTGKGAGQWRHIASRSNNTFTIDRAWDVVPAADDHFTLGVPSFENVIISSNQMTGNPTGIALWAGTFLNVLVANNRLTDNSGIYIDAKSTQTLFNSNSPQFSAYKNVEIKNNQIANTNSSTSAYIHIGVSMLYPNSFWGSSTYGIEVRGNKITARPGTYAFIFPEGYQNAVYYQNKTPFADNGLSGLLGTVFQSNACVNCGRVFTLNTGALDTVIWNTSVTTAAGVSSTFIYDVAIASTTTKKSIGTIVGHD